MWAVQNLLRLRRCASLAIASTRLLGQVFGRPTIGQQSHQIGAMVWLVMTCYDYDYDYAACTKRLIDLHMGRQSFSQSWKWSNWFSESQFAFVAFAFLVGFGIEAAVGSAWMAHNPDPNGVTEKAPCEWSEFCWSWPCLFAAVSSYGGRLVLTPCTKRV